jgi:hypothetical protein
MIRNLLIHYEKLNQNLNVVGKENEKLLQIKLNNMQVIARATQFITKWIWTRYQEEMYQNIQNLRNIFLGEYLIEEQ